VKFEFVHRFAEVRYCAVEMAHIGKNCLIVGAICTRDSISVDKSEVQSWRTSSPEAILKQVMESALGGDRGSNMTLL
jgi:hypothetical protein